MILQLLKQITQIVSFARSKFISFGTVQIEVKLSIRHETTEIDSCPNVSHCQMPRCCNLQTKFSPSSKILYVTHLSSYRWFPMSRGRRCGDSRKEFLSIMTFLQVNSAGHTIQLIVYE